MTTGHKIRQYIAFWHLTLAIVLLMVGCLISASPALADDFNARDYFQFSYDPFIFDKSQITGSEGFQVTVTVRAVCSRDLPVSASQATITSLVVAKHTASGVMVTLNTEYIVIIKPFPSKKGETAEISQSVPLRFPAGAASGDYDVIGQIANATVKVSIIPIPVASFLPREQFMGTVQYTTPEPSPVPIPNPPNEPVPSVPPESNPTPSETTPTPNPNPNPTPSPSPLPSDVTPVPEPTIPWWVEIIILIAVATTIFNVVWFLRHRRRYR